MSLDNNDIVIIESTILCVNLIGESTSMLNCCWRSEVKCDYLTTVQQSPAASIPTGIFRKFIITYHCTKYVSGHKRIWAQTCVGTNVSGHKRVWAQTYMGINVSGHKRVWAQTCLGTNVSGLKRVWAQSCGLKYVRHRRVVSVAPTPSNELEFWCLRLNLFLIQGRRQ